MNTIQPHPLGRGGDTRIRHTGMCQNFGLFFARNPQTWVPFVRKKSLFMGLIFEIFQVYINFENLVCFCSKIERNGYLFFFTKIPKYGYLFLEKIPLNMVMDMVWDQSKSEYPPLHPRTHPHALCACLMKIKDFFTFRRNF